MFRKRMKYAFEKQWRVIRLLRRRKRFTTRSKINGATRKELRTQ
jgi:hypothetical protein